MLQIVVKGYRLQRIKREPIVLSRHRMNQAQVQVEEEEEDPT